MEVLPDLLEVPEVLEAPLVFLLAWSVMVLVLGGFVGLVRGFFR